MSLYQYVAGEVVTVVDPFGLWIPGFHQMFWRKYVAPNVYPIIPFEYLPFWWWSHMSEDEAEWCRAHPVLCDQLGDLKDDLWDEMMHTFPKDWQRNPTSIHNAILHCSLACVFKNATDNVNAWDALELHERKAKPGCERGMDLWNNDQGWSIDVPGPTTGDIIKQCIAKCTQKAKDGTLVWLTPPSVKDKNLPEGNINCPPGAEEAQSDLKGCCYQF
jgi:hypothetical protein